MLVWYLHVNLLEAHWLPGIRWNVRSRGWFYRFALFLKNTCRLKPLRKYRRQCPRGVLARSCLLCTLLRLCPGRGGPGGVLRLNVGKPPAQAPWTLLFGVHFSQHGPESMLRPSALDFLSFLHSLILHFALVTWGRQVTRGICHDHYWVNILESVSTEIQQPVGLPISQMLKHSLKTGGDPVLITLHPSHFLIEGKRKELNDSGTRACKDGQWLRELFPCYQVKSYGPPPPHLGCIDFDIILHGAQASWTRWVNTLRPITSHYSNHVHTLPWQNFEGL